MKFIYIYTIDYCSIKAYMKQKLKPLKPHVLKPILKDVALVIKNKLMLQKP